MLDSFIRRFLAAENYFTEQPTEHTNDES
jgi:hypothetical protein